MTAGIGHNSGRVNEPGFRWRKHVWTQARKDLLPRLPIEVVRRRVARAKELGLPYRTYAGFRASNGHDLIGFLFSTNALRVFRDGAEIPRERRDQLERLVRCSRVALVHKPVHADRLNGPIDAAINAPSLTQSWSSAGRVVRFGLTKAAGPADRFVMVAETGLEREWAEAARMAGVLSGDAVFSADL